MAGKVVPMGTRLLAALTADVSSVGVSELCRDLGVSRQTFYKYRRRFEQEGPAGLVER
jgi:transposase-like protein